MTENSWYARPVFFVKDCEAARAFYSKLGFAEEWRFEEDGTVVALQVQRAGAELILNRNPERAGGGRLFLSLEAGEASRCEKEFAAKDVRVSHGHWGMPVLVIQDPDGNELLLTDDAWQEERPV